jgi:predicted small integral membrane protein
MNILRVSKSIVCFSLAIFALLVGWNNVADYGSNYAFVQHTLSMDTVFPDNALKSRAILDPFIWRFAYGLIIATQFLIGVLLLTGSIGLLISINSPLEFNKAKSWVYLGCLTGFILWFFGFIVIGGEWFCMWQSEKWNGVEAAFRFVVLFMFTFLFIAMSDSENYNK